MLNLRKLKWWEWLAVGGLVVVLGFLFFTNGAAATTVRNRIREKYEKQEDELHNEQKHDKVDDINDKDRDIGDAMDEAQAAHREVEDEINRLNGEMADVDKEVDDFNKFMDKK